MYWKIEQENGRNVQYTEGTEAEALEMAELWSASDKPGSGFTASSVQEVPQGLGLMSLKEQLPNFR